MDRLYTKTGDDGMTGWLGSGRLPKHHPRIEAVGAVDEATAALGLARSLCRADEIDPLLARVQRDLYHLMAELAADPENAARFRKIDADRLAWIEAETDRITAGLQPPKDFILPGETPGSGALAVARTTVRRAERRVAALIETAEVANPFLLRYLNRLSSLCFGLELLENAHNARQTRRAKEDGA